MDTARVSALDQVRMAITTLPERDDDAAGAIARRVSDVLRPSGAFARLDAVAEWLGAWQRTPTPHVDRPSAVLFAADHGVAAEGVSAYPPEVTASMLAAFRAEASTLHALARRAGATVHVVDVGVGAPTANLRVAPAMTTDGFTGAFNAGRDAVRSIVQSARGCDLLVLGEMGIGNTTAAAALCARLLGGDISSWVGRGTGVEDEQYRHKIEVITDAVTRTATTTDPLELFSELGGHELAAIAGAIVEARHQRTAVVLDGFVVGAALLPLWLLNPAVIDHCVAGHCSEERGHRALLRSFGLTPLLDLGLRLGEGSGAMAAVPLVAMACAAVVEVPTFTEWFDTAPS